MKPSILSLTMLLSIALLLTECGQKKSEKSEESFLGDWYTIKGDVGAYSFQKDENSYIFFGTVGMRPVIYGTWNIDNEKFVITMDNGKTTEYSFSLSNDTLTFNDGEEIYTRTLPLEVKYPEVQMLVNISSDFSDLKFSAPQPANLNWGYWIDSTQSAKEFSLKGFSISAKSLLSSGYSREISEFLKDNGFESDTLFMSEICDGYWAENQIITICVTQDYDSESDSVDLRVTSGLIIK